MCVRVVRSVAVPGNGRADVGIGIVEFGGRWFTRHEGNVLAPDLMAGEVRMVQRHVFELNSTCLIGPKTIRSIQSRVTRSWTLSFGSTPFTIARTSRSTSSTLPR
jgi:hypothetical protein